MFMQAKMRIVSLSLILLILLLPLTPLQEQSPVYVNENKRVKLSPALLKELKIVNDSDELEFIVQFNSPTSILEKLDSLGIEVIYRYQALPAIFAKGSKESIMKLSQQRDVRWIEPNLRMMMDMEKSTSVINASKVWSREIIDVSKAFPYIDGEGVTVVVVDTGIDAGHPDLDYGEKTLVNVYLSRENGYAWIEDENTDLYYGHGTHVAGTVAGSGDASAGSRRGVAPGANIIGVTIYDPTVADYLIALEWVYEHSRPNANPYNIRVATNSWHSSVGEYDPESALAQIIEKLTFENNVVTTWSAGNDGRDDPEGDEITTSQQGNTPVAICVAAYERDGSAVTDFSSRGKVGLNQTYPDIGAPGRHIWSTSARRTLISGGTYIGGNRNPYYLAISGTSMSTPHVAGLVALLFQACPSLKVSERHEDYNGNDTSWWSNPRTRIHEAEWIIEASATYLEPTKEHGVIAEVNNPGMDGRPQDYVQGYGIVNAEKAVAIALTLEKLRKSYPDKNITVADALEFYERVMTENLTIKDTNLLYTQWHGEFSQFDDLLGNTLSDVNQTKYVFVPEGTKRAIIDLSYEAIDASELKSGDITFTIDFDGDGESDYTGDISPNLMGVKHEEIDVSSKIAGERWTFDIIGEGFKVINPVKERNYVEVRIEYTLSVQLILDTSSEIQVYYDDYDSIVAPLRFGIPTPEYTSGSVAMTVNYYDLNNVYFPEEEKVALERKEEFPWWLLVIGVLVVLGIAYLVLRLKQS